MKPYSLTELESSVAQVYFSEVSFGVKIRSRVIYFFIAGKIERKGNKRVCVPNLTMKCELLVHFSDMCKFIQHYCSPNLVFI